jgi:hypothetical protein
MHHEQWLGVCCWVCAVQCSAVVCAGACNLHNRVLCAKCLYKWCCLGVTTLSTQSGG